MKRMKLALMTLLMMGAANTVKAQQDQNVFDIVLKSAESVVNNPKASEFDLKVNQFKVTALLYVRNQGIKKNGKVPTTVLEEQAYGLHMFLFKYLNAIKNTPAENRKDCIMTFVQVTRNHPMYDDKDKETTESFVKDPGGFTPFSINVNWAEALAELEEAEKKK